MIASRVDVLLVGRSEAALGMLETLLTRRGITAAIAHDLATLRELVATQKPAVAIYDHSRGEAFDLDPSASGFCGQILVLSDESAYRLRQLEMPATFIRKPVSVAELIDQVTSFLDGKMENPG